jgi:ribosomal protein L37AE/L43A
MTIFGIRDRLAPHSCPRCGSTDTQRIGRNSNGERIIHCEKCQYYGIVKPFTDVKDSFQADYDDGASRKSKDEGE